MGDFDSLVLERRVLQWVLVLIVLLSAVQFSRQYERQREALFLANPFLEEEVTEVFSSREGSYLLIKLMNREREPEAYLLINDTVVASFTKNPILLDVRIGDRISLDTRETQQLLWFTILDTSEEIQSFWAGEEYWFKPHLYYLGEVRESM